MYLSELIRERKDEEEIHHFPAKVVSDRKVSPSNRFVKRLTIMMAPNIYLCYIGDINTWSTSCANF